jgi:DNA-binding transcriptional ArsR family regulator
MPEPDKTDFHWVPAEVRIITDLETLQTVADPLRLRILALLRREPRAVKALAAELDIAPTKLYYHIKLLEEHGLIGVARTRSGSGPVEKEYGVTSYRLAVDRALLSPGASPGDDALDTFLSLVLDSTKSEVKRSVQAGLINPDPAYDGPDGLSLGRRWLRLTPEEAAAFYARIRAVEEEFTALHPIGGEDEPGVRLYEMLFGFYATLPPEQDEAPMP